MLSHNPEEFLVEKEVSDHEMSVDEFFEILGDWKNSSRSQGRCVDLPDFGYVGGILRDLSEPHTLPEK